MAGSTPARTSSSAVERVDRLNAIDQQAPEFFRAARVRKAARHADQRNVAVSARADVTVLGHAPFIGERSELAASRRARKPSWRRAPSVPRYAGSRTPPRARLRQQRARDGAPVPRPSDTGNISTRVRCRVVCVAQARMDRDYEQRSAAELKEIVPQSDRLDPQNIAPHVRDRALKGRSWLRRRARGGPGRCQRCQCLPIELAVGRQRNRSRRTRRDGTMYPGRRIRMRIENVRARDR